METVLYLKECHENCPVLERVPRKLSCNLPEEVPWELSCSLLEGAPWTLSCTRRGNCHGNCPAPAIETVPGATEGAPWKLIALSRVCTVPSAQHVKRVREGKGLTLTTARFLLAQTVARDRLHEEAGVHPASGRTSSHRSGLEPRSISVIGQIHEVLADIPPPLPLFSPLLHLSSSSSPSPPTSPLRGGEQAFTAHPEDPGITKKPNYRRSARPGRPLSDAMQRGIIYLAHLIQGLQWRRKLRLKPRRCDQRVNRFRRERERGWWG